MSKFLDSSVKQKRLQYERANLQMAYCAVRDKGLSVYKASRLYQVPESTLRDRTRVKVDVDAKVGKETIFSYGEEKDLVNHLTYMAGIGYGYTKTDIQVIAKDFAIAIGKQLRLKSEDSSRLSNNWFYGFLSRWEDLKLVRPQKLSLARAKNASPDTLKKYFKELSTILTNNNLHEKPNRIFNIDETGITTDHSPPKVVINKYTKPQSITSDRTATITIIAGGNAMGNYIPPYYVFPGKRWNTEFLEGAAPGSAGEMSETGWSNTSIFHNYITTHFSRHAGITDKNDQEPTLILYDGHRSHISLTLADWAKKHNVVLFVLPPHTSHLTQPLDVGIFGPLKNMYYRECASYLQQNPGISVTKFDVAKLTSKPYLKAMSPENLVSSFRKTGIYPFNNTAILPDETTPSAIYPANILINNTVSEEVENVTAALIVEESNDNTSSNDVHVDQSKILQNNTEAVNNEKETNENNTSRSLCFFDSRTIKNALVKKPKRKFVPPYIAGSLSKSLNLDILNKKTGPTPCKKTKSAESLPAKKKKESVNKPQAMSASKQTGPLPSTSGTAQKGGPLTLSEETTDSEIEYTDDEETCCVCEKWQPDDLLHLAGSAFVKWGKCDFCDHWTHLTFCSPVKILRRDSVFRCPHCSQK